MGALAESVAKLYRGSSPVEFRVEIAGALPLAWADEAQIQRVLVPRDAVGDRNPAAHEANLYDIDTKYGDVVTTDDVLAALEVPA